MKPQSFFDKKDLVALALVTAITVFAWIGFEAYRTINNYTISEETREQITPLDPTLKQDVFTRLQNTQP